LLLLSFGVAVTINIRNIDVIDTLMFLIIVIASGWRARHIILESSV